MAPSALRQNPIYISLYVFWSKFILVELIPYFLIVIMNIFIIIKLSQSDSFRQKFACTRRNEGNEEAVYNEANERYTPKSTFSSLLRS